MDNYNGINDDDHDRVNEDNHDIVNDNDGMNESDEEEGDYDRVSDDDHDGVNDDDGVNESDKEEGDYDKVSDDDYDRINDNEYEEEDDYDRVNNNSDIEFIQERKKLLNENTKGKTYLTILYVITLQYLIDICVDDDGDNTFEEDKKGHVIDKALN